MQFNKTVSFKPKELDTLYDWVSDAQDHDMTAEEFGRLVYAACEKWDGCTGGDDIVVEVG